MPILVVCQGCGAKLNAPDAGAGKHVRCPRPGCGELVPVPELLVAEEVEVQDAVVVKPPSAPRKVAAIVVDDDEEVRQRRRRREDDDDEYEHDRPRRPKREKSGLGAGAVAGIVCLSLLFLGGIGFGIYSLLKATGVGSGKGGLFGTTKTEPPAGWKEYSYPADGFRAYFPAKPEAMTIPVNSNIGFPSRDPRGPISFLPKEDLPPVESCSMYHCGDRNGPVTIEIQVIRFRSAIPSSYRSAVRSLPSGTIDRFKFEHVSWLGYDALDRSMDGAKMRAVYTDRALILATVAGPRFTRVQADHEAAFFDNFALTE